LNPPPFCVLASLGTCPPSLSPGTILPVPDFKPRVSSSIWCFSFSLPFFLREALFVIPPLVRRSPLTFPRLTFFMNQPFHFLSLFFIPTPLRSPYGELRGLSPLSINSPPRFSVVYFLNGTPFLRRCRICVAAFFLPTQLITGGNSLVPPSDFLKAPSSLPPLKSFSPTPPLLFLRFWE